MITTILIIFLILIITFTSITLFYSLRRINQYENLLIEIEKIIKYSSEKMKQVDSLGHYEADDETGFFFKQLKDIQQLLSEIFEKEQQEGNKNG